MSWLALGMALVVGLVLAAALIPRPITVMPWEAAILYRRGRFERVLGPGSHWPFGLGQPTVARVTTAAQSLEVGPAELFARDGFGFRASVSLVWRVVDPPGYWEASAGVGFLPGVRLAGFDEAVLAALIEAAAARPLDETLADPQPLGAAVLAALAGRFPAVSVETATVTRVTLPPEVRRLQTEVETARLTGLAALERARAEQAALRSLANAARLVRDNPELAQLRLLQAIESAKRPPTIVLGGAAVGVGGNPSG